MKELYEGTLLYETNLVFWSDRGRRKQENVMQC